MVNGTFNIKLISELNCSEVKVEWVEKVELVSNLCGVKRPETIIPLRLTGGAFSVYQQLSEEERADAAQIKDALYTAFAVYEQFEAWKMGLGETVDV